MFCLAMISVLCRDGLCASCPSVGIANQPGDSASQGSRDAGCAAHLCICVRRRCSCLKEWLIPAPCQALRSRCLKWDVIIWTCTWFPLRCVLEKLKKHEWLFTMFWWNVKMFFCRGSANCACTQMEDKRYWKGISTQKYLFIDWFIDWLQLFINIPIYIYIHMIKYIPILLVIVKPWKIRLMKLTLSPKQDIKVFTSKSSINPWQSDSHVTSFVDKNAPDTGTI